MAKLKGNDLAEWIKALVPVDPESFKTMAKGTLIIHLESDTMEPDQFDHLDSQNNGVIWFKPSSVFSVPAHELFDGLTWKRVENWFIYPPPAPEVPIRSTTIGKVKELGDGKWK